MNIKITSKNGIVLKTANKYCAEDINVVLDMSLISDAANLNGTIWNLGGLTANNVLEDKYFEVVFTSNEQTFNSITVNSANEELYFDETLVWDSTSGFQNNSNRIIQFGETPVPLEVFEFLNTFAQQAVDLGNCNIIWQTQPDIRNEFSYDVLFVSPGATTFSNITAINGEVYYTATIHGETMVFDGLAWTDLGIPRFYFLEPVPIGLVKELSKYAYFGIEPHSNKTITENGDYYITEYDSVTVDVSAPITFDWSGMIDKTISGDITIPESMTNVGLHAFYNCTNLTGVTVPSSVKTLGSSAFYNCSGLQRVTLSEGLETLGSMCFTNNLNLVTEITIPSTVTTINASALRFSPRTTKLVVTMLPTTPPTLSTSVFYTTYLGKIIVPKGTLSAYSSATNWSAYADYFEEAS